MNNPLDEISPTTLPDLESLKNLARTDVDQWRRLLITGGARLPFKPDQTYDVHPLRAFFEVSRAREGKIFLYTELYSLAAEKLGIVPSDVAGNTVSVRAQILLSMSLHLDPWLGEDIERDDPHWYLSKVTSTVEESVAYALLEVAEKVACGVPLYRVGDEGELTRIQDNEQPVTYLIGKYKYREAARSLSALPDWVHGHVFKQSELEAVTLFFGDSASELSDAQIQARRTAYRASLGIEPSKSEGSTASGPYPSKLNSALQEVRRRYYGSNFSLNDQQTWPKQKDVVEWLRDSRGLSEREASAVDIVARPDALRGKA